MSAQCRYLMRFNCGVREIECIYLVDDVLTFCCSASTDPGLLNAARVLVFRVVFVLLSSVVYQSVALLLINQLFFCWSISRSFLLINHSHFYWSISLTFTDQSVALLLINQTHFYWSISCSFQLHCCWSISPTLTDQSSALLLINQFYFCWSIIRSFSD